MIDVRTSSRGARICMPTFSTFARQVFRTGLYAAQQVLASCDDVDVIRLEPTRGFRLAHAAVRRLIYHDPSRRLASMSPGLRPVRLAKDYDLFLVHCNFIEDLWYANAIRGWRDRCATAVCWIEELWSDSVPRIRSWLPLLSRFDHVIVSVPGSGKTLGDALGRPCHEMDLAVDALRFSPLPNPPRRVIDVYSPGRRWPDIHRRFLDSMRGDMLYVYDTLERTAELPVLDHTEHRDLYTDLTKRSRFLVVGPAKLDATPNGGQVGFGYRYFEGCAAGAVLVGQAARCEAFRRNFDWPDAVVEIRPDGSDAVEVISSLAKDPARLRAMSWRNVDEALRRHDWLHRWKSVLALAGLEPSPQMHVRERRLAELAALARQRAVAGRPE
jgi:hypothetical protein